MGIAGLVWTIGVIANLVLGLLMAGRLLGGGGPTAAVPARLIPGVAALDIVVTGRLGVTPGDYRSRFQQPS